MSKPTSPTWIDLNPSLLSAVATLGERFASTRNRMAPGRAGRAAVRALAQLRLRTPKQQGRHPVPGTGSRSSARLPAAQTRHHRSRPVRPPQQVPPVFPALPTPPGHQFPATPTSLLASPPPPPSSLSGSRDRTGRTDGDLLRSRSIRSLRITTRCLEGTLIPVGSIRARNSR